MGKTHASAGAFAIACTAIALGGCSGHLYTVEDAVPEDTGGDKSERRFRGIPVYGQLNVIELYQMRTHIDEKTNKVLGKAINGDCVPVFKQVFSVRTDYRKRMFVRYDPGPFDSSKFALTLKDGALASVNADSDSTAGLKNLASILPFAIAPYGEKTTASTVSVPSEPGADGKAKPDGANDEKKLACNAEPKLVGLYEAPGVRSFDELQKAIETDEALFKSKGGNKGNTGAGSPGTSPAVK